MYTKCMYISEYSSAPAAGPVDRFSPHSFIPSFFFPVSSDCREFTAASTNPTGDAVVLGNYNALFIFTRNKDTMSWEDKGVTKVRGGESAAQCGVCGHHVTLCVSGSG